MLPLSLLLLGASGASACSRVVYDSEDAVQRKTIGRSMDFVAPTNTTIFAFPAGLKRNGGIDDNPYTWTSKYGSTVTNMYNLIFVDGVNSQGLAGSALYLGGADYETRDPSRQGMSVALWMQYHLDMYATVNETVAAVCNPDKALFQVVPKRLIPGIGTDVHLALTDTTGDTVIMEFAEKKLKCWHSIDYNVMTNEPTFDQQLAIEKYWEPVSNSSLPGSSRPPDRFVRLAYYRKSIPTAKDLTTAVSYVAGMIRAVSTPIVPSSLQAINGEDTWPTFWRVYQDLVDGMFFYESATSPLFIWFSYKDFDLSSSGKSKVLDLTGEPWEKLAGNVTSQFVDVEADLCKKIYTEC